jgi:mRNA interferase RelE/StbE
VSYRVVILPRAQKQIRSIPSRIVEIIEEKLRSLAENPRPAGCKKLRGRDEAWRTRVGDYRIIYEIDDAQTTVTVAKVGHRSEIYR